MYNGFWTIIWNSKKIKWTFSRFLWSVKSCIRKLMALLSCYKSRNTRRPFFRSVTGGSPYKSEVGRGEACLLARGKELRTLVSLRVARGIIFIQVSSRARWAHFLFLRAVREKNCFSKQAKRHQTLLKYRLLSGGDVLDEAPLVLTYYSGFFNEMNTVNSLRLKIRWSLFLIAIAGNSTLLSLDGKTWTSNTLWPRPHLSDGLLSLMDSWFYPW